MVVVATAAVLAALQLGRMATQSKSEPTAHRQRVVLGSGNALEPTFGVAPAPDGSGILFSDTEADWWKPRDQVEAVQIPNLNAKTPAFSPDGQRVAYVDGVARQLRMWPLHGGTTVPLADSVRQNVTPALAWLDDGTILFGNDFGNGKTGLERISEDGEGRALVAGPDRIEYPQHVSGLIGGGGALVSSCENALCLTPTLYLVDLKRDTVGFLAQGVRRAWHVPGERVVYVARDGVLQTARLDVDGLQLGPAAPLFDTGPSPTRVSTRSGTEWTAMENRSWRQPLLSGLPRRVTRLPVAGLHLG